MEMLVKNYSESFVYICNDYTNQKCNLGGKYANMGCCEHCAFKAQKVSTGDISKQAIVHIPEPARAAKRLYEEV